MKTFFLREEKILNQFQRQEKDFRLMKECVFRTLLIKTFDAL